MNLFVNKIPYIAAVFEMIKNAVINLPICTEGWKVDLAMLLNHVM